MLFKILLPYHEEFIPKLSLQDLPQPITEMFNPATLAMNYIELLREYEKAFDTLKVCTVLSCTPLNYYIPKYRSQLIRLRDTLGQSADKVWFIHRAGRITASNFKSVCHTNPSPKRICYPDVYKFSNEATKYLMLLNRLYILIISNLL